MDFYGRPFGKRKFGLVVRYQKIVFFAVLIRNLFKFLPWQLGHIGNHWGLHRVYKSDRTCLYLLKCYAGYVFLERMSVI